MTAGDSVLVDTWRPMPTRFLSRRLLLASGVVLTTPGVSLASDAYGAFLEQVRAEALEAGISRRTVEEALTLAQPNQRVIQLDRHQPEFTLTWSEYRARVLPAGRLEKAKASFASNRALFSEVETRFGVDAGVIVGIWGLESDFGSKRGTFGVCDSLATLAFDGRRRQFFRAELMNALTIIDKHGIPAEQMLGSYAGAMGQPQFMPSAYLHYARAFGGGTDADIWTSVRDVLASIANYLARSGWRKGEPWGQQVMLTRSIDPAIVGRGNARSLGEWQADGVRRSNGTMFSRSDVHGALLLPDGSDGDAFLVYRNFEAIRRYNPSDFYALAVGLLGDNVV